jgi:hypothetical protein
VGIIVICGFFEKEDKFGYPTDEKEFGVSHGVDMITGQSVVLPWVSHPELLGAKFNQQIGEWVLYDD